MKSLIRGVRKKIPNIFKHFLKLNTFSVHLRLMTLTWFVISFFSIKHIKTVKRKGNASYGANFGHLALRGKKKASKNM